MNKDIQAATIRKYAPTAAQVSPVDPVMTNFSVGHMQKDTVFVTSRFGAAGVLKSDTKTGTYFIHNKTDWFRSRAGKVGNKGPTPNIEHGLSTSTFDCDIWGCSTETPTVIADIAGSQGIAMEQDDAEYVADGMMLGLEQDWASKVFTASPAGSAWGASWAGAASDAFGSSQCKYFNQSGSKPVEAIHRVRKAIITACGRIPNFMVIGPDVDVALQNNADLIDRHPGASRVVLGEPDYAAIFKVENVFVANASYNSAHEGVTTATMADCFGKSIWLGYVEPSMGPKKKTAFARVDWTGMRDSVEGMAVTRYADQRNRTLITDAVRAWVHVIPDLSCGGFISLCVE